MGYVVAVTQSFIAAAATAAAAAAVTLRTACRTYLLYLLVVFEFRHKARDEAPPYRAMRLTLPAAAADAAADPPYNQTAATATATSTSSSGWAADPTAAAAAAATRTGRALRRPSRQRRKPAARSRGNGIHPWIRQLAWILSYIQV